MHDKGFTLVEVMVALVVVAIVSTPLLQMFVTTSYANKGAQVMDMANVLAVQKAETFKADPEAVYNPDHPDSYYFYKGDGTPILPEQAFYDLTVIPDEAAIRITSHLPGPTVTTSGANVGYYPDFASIIDLSHYSADINVSITNTNKISVESVLSTIDSSKIKNNIIPIRVNAWDASRTISVTNESNLEAEFYVFNAIGGISITLSTLQGAASIASVSPDSTSSDKAYDLTLTVNRLDKGVWVEMFTYSADKHIYN